ncbi:inositol monophosphatase family protein [Helicobacter cappadocius]|uniref:Inositol monophosphatase family protein n=1 Tax=Helicobacter cappadocius TaxID=3063998 RepID=A0AA90PJ91_9HELI|nr:MULTISPECIES: inositol monophosphatase family protein [unclassified Helicobacter]MDO7252803.1 inositol monophosphatase family protein [Helicobacter sp. faydin-H75]MDP2538846.1 inositol monophosphatase family protein [Helicobacter sp. faydin-H76]
MSDFIQASIRSSKQIIEMLSQRKPQYMKKHRIGAGGDISLGADLLSEEIFMEYFLELGSVDSEESGYIQGKGSDIIVLDPLDGSDNYLSNIPYYGASIALCDENRHTKEAIVINFCTQIAHYSDGNGIKYINLNSDLEISKNQTLPKCGIFEKSYSNPLLCTKMYEQKMKFRSLGAIALSLASAHDVNFVFFAGNIREYDCKAGLFLCNGLWIKKSDSFLLVSKNKQIFDIITKIAED